MPVSRLAGPAAGGYNAAAASPGGGAGEGGTVQDLFITSTRIGDAVLSTGVLAHLVETRPGSRITIACGPLAAPLFRAVPGLERIIVLERRSFARHWLDLWGRTVTTRWDLVVDLRDSPVSRLVPARRRAILTGRRAPGHKVCQNAAVLGLADPPAPFLWLGAPDRAAAQSLVPDGAPVLALAPAANWPAKQWRAERFAELARRLTGPGGVMEGARVAVFAAPAERAACEPVIEAVPPDRRIDLVGRTDPLLAAACIARCRLFVGNDSGLMHIAAAVGTPTLGLFGPGHPELYAPWGGHAAFIAGAPVTAADGSPTLMDGLSVAAVADAVETLWRRTRPAAR